MLPHVEIGRLQVRCIGPGASADATRARLAHIGSRLLPAALDRTLGDLDDRTTLVILRRVATHVPLVDATRHLVNSDNIGLVKPGTVLLNFSRDGVVSESAVLAALSRQHLGWYVCDFPSASTPSRQLKEIPPSKPSSKGRGEAWSRERASPAPVGASPTRICGTPKRW